MAVRACEGMGLLLAFGPLTRCCNLFPAAFVLECAHALPCLPQVSYPRVFSLTKIVEIAHFNMGRIRSAGCADCLSGMQKVVVDCECCMIGPQHLHTKPSHSPSPAARQAGVEPHLGGAGRLLHRGTPAELGGGRMCRHQHCNLGHPPILSAAPRTTNSTVLPPFTHPAPGRWAATPT